MEYGIYPDLTKKYILQRITEEDIMEYYCGVPITNEMICSPLRIDNTPTFGFNYSDKSGKLRAKDFAGYFWGDCFDVVAYRLNQSHKLLKAYDIAYVVPSDKRGFGIILDKIARDFKLHKYGNNDEEINLIKAKKNHKIAKLNKFVKIDIKPRDWNKYDKQFWNPIGVFNKETFKKYNVIAVKFVWINGNFNYEYNHNDPCYAYYFGKDENNNNIFKLYFPYRKYYRFMQNKNVLQGVEQYNPGQFGLMIKSYKDVIVADSLGVSAYAPAAESDLISKADFDSLAILTDYTFTLLDYDPTGIHMSWVMRKTYNTIPMFITNYPLKKSNVKVFPNGVKDLSDYRSYYGRQKTLDLINKIKDRIDEKYNY